MIMLADKQVAVSVAIDTNEAKGLGCKDCHIPFSGLLSLQQLDPFSCWSQQDPYGQYESIMPRGTINGADL